MIQAIAKDRTEEWYSLRSTGVGASESGAVCGLSPYETAVDVWNRKVGRVDQKTVTPVMELGTFCEPDMFTAVEMSEEISQRSPGLFRHPDLPYVLASPDGVLADGRGLELKVTSDRNEELGGDPDDLPPSWLCQAQQQMAVCGFPAVVFGVAILPADTRDWLLNCVGAAGAARVIGEGLRSGAIPVRFWTVDRHSKAIDGILNKVSKFWRHVQTQTPPPVDIDHSRACDAIKAAFRESKVLSLVDLDDELAAKWRKRQQRKAYMKAAEKFCERVDAEMLLKIRDFSGGRFPDGSSVRKVQVGAAQIAAYTRKPYSYLKGSK